MQKKMFIGVVVFLGFIFIGLSNAQGNMVDLNTASVEILSTLPGVGKVVAQRIVDFREQKGSFKAVDDLLAVKGIGKKKLKKMKHLITVSQLLDKADSANKGVNTEKK